VILDFCGVSNHQIEEWEEVPVEVAVKASINKLTVNGKQ
jgi:hypothetical protein